MPVVVSAEQVFRRLALCAMLLSLFLGGLLRVRAQAEQLEVGYAVLAVAPGSTAAVATALFSFRNRQGVLVSEAGVQAVELLRRGRLFVDQSASQTGVAFANPNPEPAELQLQLRDDQGRGVSQGTLVLEPGHHLPRFVDQLFPGLSADFSGTLSFEAAPGSPPVAAVTLRQALNGQREPLLATLPVVALEEPAEPTGQSPGTLIFPHLGAGSGAGLQLSTQVILINRVSQAVQGRVRLRDSLGQPLLVETEQGEQGSELAYELAPHGSWKRTLSSRGGLVQGFATVTAEEGSLPAGTAIFQFRDPQGKLVSEAGVGAAVPTSRARIFVDTVETQTGLALANSGQAQAAIVFRLLDRRGNLLRDAARQLGAGRHTSLFVDELFPGLPPGFTGILEIESPVPLALVTLKLSTNARRDLILTTLPVADPTRPLGAVQLVLPQIGFGQGFATRVILLSEGADSAAAGRLTWFRSDGSPLAAPLAGQETSLVDYAIPAGGALQMRPGDRASAATIVVDIFEPSRSEIAVNRGASVLIHPLVIDSEGTFRDDFEVGLQSADPAVAEVDEATIRGRQPGFSTLLLEAGGAVAATTIAVVEVNRGGALLDAVGVARDVAGSVYLASNSRHSILRGNSLEEIPSIYAGTDGQPGFRDSTRLGSLFNLPSHLAYNQADGSLYVSDSANHVIRRVLPGANDRVETFAGSGTPGDGDGSALDSSFNRPSGLVLDGRGGLWIADSGNHTIRRLDLVSDQVETVAGLAGAAGFRDGPGREARFAGPAGLALEAEPLLVQLDRELRGLPPPLVSVIVADSGNGVLRRVREDGLVESLLVSPSSADPTDRPRPRLRFEGVGGAAVDAVGNIFFTDGEEVRVVLPNGAVVSAAQPGSFFGPRGLATGPDGRVVVTDSMGSSELLYGPPTITTIDPPAVANIGGRITIQGGNFSQDTLAVVAARVLPVRIADTSQLTIDLPALPSGLTTVSLQNRGGIAQARLFVRPASLKELAVGQITTVAGGSTFIGDGGPAGEASLFTPQGLALDPGGNLYVADSDHFRVRKIDLQSGLIITVAGTGEEGISPPLDGTLATAADLRSPQKLTLDGAGNLFLSGFSESAIRKVDATTGQIRAAVPIFGFHEIAADASGNLFISRGFAHRVERWNPNTGSLEPIAGNGDRGFSGDGGPALEASLDFPVGLALDSAGNLFIAENGNRRVRRVDASSRIITSASGPLPEGQAVAIDGFGNLYVGGFGGRLIKIEAGSGRELQLGQFQDTQHLAADAAGRLFLSDPEANLVLQVDTTTGESRPVAGTGAEPERGDGDEAAAAILIRPEGLAFDNQGNLIVADSRDQRIRFIRATDRVISTVAGTGRVGHIQPPDGIQALQASLFFPGQVAVDAQGNVFFTDSALWRIDPITGRMTMLLPTINAEGLTLDPNGHPVFSTLGHEVLRLELPSRRLVVVAGNGMGGFSGDGGPPDQASLNVPQGLAYDSRGNLYVADLFNRRIRRISAETGTITTVAGGGNQQGVDNIPATEALLGGPRDVALDADGNLYVLEAFAVRRVDAQSGLITTVARSRGFDFAGDNGPATQAGFQVEQIEIGPDGNLYLADAGNHRVRAVRLQ